jgi:hypothetical protein
MNLIEVDAIGLKPPQALVDFSANRFRVETVRRIARGIPYEAALREDIWPLARRHIVQRPADNLFGVPETVDRCRVDPVDAALDGAANGRNRVRIILRSPSETPFATDGPRAESDASQCES